MAVKRESSILDLIRGLDGLARLRLEDAFRPYDVTPGQYAVLASLRGAPGMSASQLARRAEVRPQSINEMVIALAGKGLVEREEDPDNRRVLKIRLSARGRKVLRACDAARDKVEHDLLALIPAKDRAILARLLTALLAGGPAADTVPVQADLFASLAPRAGGRGRTKAP